MLMYEFHYVYMESKYVSKVTLCYMETGSLMYEIAVKDFHRDIAEDAETKFDKSEYSRKDTGYYR